MPSLSDVSRIGALIAAVGCSGERTLHLELPPIEGARSAVFAFHVEPELEVQVIDLDERPVVVELPVDLEAGASGSIEVLVYRDTLEELGLGTGHLAGVSQGQPLPDEEGLYVAEFSGGEVGDWSASQRSERVAAIRIPDPNPCTRFTVDGEPMALEGSGSDINFALSIGPEEVLIAIEIGPIYVVHAAGSVLVTDYPSGLPTREAVRLDDERILFGGRGGEIWLGRIETSTTPSGIAIRGAPFLQVPSGSKVERIAAGEETGALEVFVLAEQGELWRHFGQWRLLHNFGVEVTRASGLVRPRPNVAYAATDQKAEVVRYLDGELAPFTPADLANGVPALAYFEEFGVVMAVSEGGMYRLDADGEWQVIGGSSVALSVYSFLPFGDGILLGGVWGIFAQYRETVGFCEDQQLGAGSIRAIVPFGNRYLFGEDKPPTGDKNVVTIIRPT